MPKLFSSLRRLFLKENKIRKYLIYALGEVVLIVIGILLALQIDNWNNTRRDLTRELAYIKSFLIDLENDKSSLLQYINDAESISEDLWVFLEFYHKDLYQPYTTDSLYLQYDRASRLRTWPHSDRTLSQLESNGEYILLRPHVGDSIAKYKLMVARLKQQETGYTEVMRNFRNTGNQYLQTHLIRFGYTKYINNERNLTGVHLPPLPDAPALKTELFNNASTYLGGLKYNVVMRATPLLEYIQVLESFLRAEYGLPDQN